MGDTRQVDLTKEWCEVLYQAKYQVKYMWSGKDAALMKRLLGWADSSFGEDAVLKIKEMMKEYLESQDIVVTSHHHPFGIFATNPTRWVKTVVQKEEKRLVESHCLTCQNEGILVYANMAYRCRCPSGDSFKRFSYAPEDAYVSEKNIGTLERLPLTPEQRLKGLRDHGWVLKKHHPELYKRIAKELSELIGRDRAVAIWKSKEFPEMDQGAPVSSVRKVEPSDQGRKPGDDSEPHPDVRVVDHGLQQHSSDVLGVPPSIREMVQGAQEIFGVSSSAVHTEVLRE